MTEEPKHSDFDVVRDETIVPPGPLPPLFGSAAGRPATVVRLATQSEAWFKPGS